MDKEGSNSNLYRGFMIEIFVNGALHINYHTIPYHIKPENFIKRNFPLISPSDLGLTGKIYSTKINISVMQW